MKRILPLFLLFGCADATLSTEGEPTLVSPAAGEQQAPAPASPGAPPADDGAPTPSVGEPPPEEEPVAAEPMRLVIEEPARGARLFGGTVHIVGRLTGGEAPVLTVGGQAITPGPGGGFSVELPAEPGLNVLVAEARDGARVTDDRRAVLVDADVDPAALVEDALDVHIGRSGLDAVSGLLSDYLRSLDLNDLIAGNVPDDVEIESISWGDLRVRLVPHDGELEVGLEVHDLRVRLRGRVRVGITVTVSGSASADPAAVTARIRASATPDGGLDLELRSPNVSLRNFDYDINNVPGFAEDWFEGRVRRFAEGLIQDALEDFVIPALFDPAALDRQIEIMGQSLDLGLRVGDVGVDSEGLSLVLDARAHAEQSVREGDAVRALPGAPQPLAGDLDMALAADFVSRILHAAWAGGVLDFQLDADSDVELPIPLSIGLLAPALGEAAQGLDRSAPLVVRMRPLLPPVARVEKAEKPLVIEAGDLLIELATPEGPVATVAVHLIARADVEVSGDGDFELAPRFEVEVHADVAETPRGPVNEALLEQQIEALAATLPALLADQTFSIGADALPVPLRLANTQFAADLGAPYLHLAATIAR